MTDMISLPAEQPRLHMWRVQPHFSGVDTDGWGHSAQGATMVVGAEDESSAAQVVSHAIFNVIGHGWVVKHCHALVYQVTGEESPYGRLVDSHPGRWVRVTYWRGGIESHVGATYAEVKHDESTYTERRF